MKITLEPLSDCVAVTINDANDARRFCEIAAMVVCNKERYEDVSDAVKKVYEEYGERQASEGTLMWDRKLWDGPIGVDGIDGPRYIMQPFGMMLMLRLRLISSIMDGR